MPKGFLPAFSVDTEEEAQKLLTLVCLTNVNGEFVAPELTREQTLENLWDFGTRLEMGYKFMKRKL